MGYPKKHRGRRKRGSKYRKAKRKMRRKAKGKQMPWNPEHYNKENMIDYKFKENDILKDVKKYIDDTYSSHYAKTTKQATEIIIDQGHGTGFCMGNILKYAQRYGKKEGRNKKDLLKVIHYAVIQLSQDHY